MHETMVRGAELAEALGAGGSSVYFLGVLSGDNPKGRVWVDSDAELRTALIWSEYQEGFQLMGRPLPNENVHMLRELIDRDIAMMLSGKGVAYFEYGTDSPELLTMMSDRYRDKSIGTELQHDYVLKKTRSRASRGGDYKIIRVDASLASAGYRNAEYVTDDIELAWGSYGAFLAKAYGFAAVVGDLIASRALITARHGRMDNLGVDTLTEFRRQGLSSALVNAVLQEAEARGRQVIWDCSDSNVASQRTAEKCGFERVRSYPVCWFRL